MITAETLGEVIDARREHLDLTRTELHTKVGMSKSYLSEITRGTKLPSLVTLIDLATALNTTPAHLLAWADK